MFRRGKLAFLSTKDDRIKIINERINLTEKHLIGMCSAFAACTRKMAKYRDAHDELAKEFKSYSDDEEINESLSEGLKNITNGVTILSDYMDLNVHRLEMKVVNELAQFENLCKTTRDNLRAAVIARDKEVLKQRQMLEIKSKFSANNSAADSELLKAKLEVNRTNKEIDEIISNFEKRKLNDVKTILTDFILISIRYHTKVLEALSANYYDVSNIDERSDFMEFQKLMKSKEDPKSRKAGLKKGLRSQSMESLDRDQLLSPLKRREKISRSNKNVAERTDDDDEEEDEDDDDEDDEEVNDDSDNTNDHDSATEDDDDDASETSEAAAAAPTATTFHVKKPKSQTQIKQPFKAVTTATHVFKHKSQNQSKGKGGIPPLAKRNAAGQSSKEAKEAAIATSTGGSRLVTVVESKRKSSAEHPNDIIDCSRGPGAARK